MLFFAGFDAASVYFSVYVLRGASVGKKEGGVLRVLTIVLDWC